MTTPVAETEDEAPNFLVAALLPCGSEPKALLYVPSPAELEDRLRIALQVLLLHPHVRLHTAMGQDVMFTVAHISEEDVPSPFTMPAGLMERLMQELGAESTETVTPPVAIRSKHVH